jgi:NAD+ synthase (glutamine-hydrolysing)
MPIPPSSFLALAGATLLVNLSASNETVAKCEYRSELIRNQSGRCLAAYAYASAGPTESTTDLVFSGHCIIVENGNDLAESSHIGDGYFSKQDKTVRIEPVRTAIADIDFQKLAYERQVQTSFADQRHLLTRQYRTIDWLGDSGAGAEGVFNMRRVNGFPFVPTDPAKLEERCAAIFDIQCAGLVKRLQSAGIKEVTIGVSGGLDSTLALLVAHKAFTILGLPTENIKAFTMPGFGTTAKTINIAKTLMENLGVTAKEIDIAPVCTQMFMDMGHKPFGIDITDIVSEAGLEDGIGYFIEKIKELPPEKRHDLIFENTQARVRTNYLMNQGFVIGTGDLSEAALGWCTYNGDHMSMYNVNCSIPKTLVRFLVKYVAEHQYEGAVRDVLLECVGMTISPELLPPDKDGKIAQSTEDSIGPYALHDFFLWNFIRCGYSPEKILFLAADTDFTDPVTGAKNDFDLQKIKATLDIFIKRFFSNQFKRDCVPGGPKVGSVSLSPRGDWRMPADASSHIWMRNEK